MRGRLARIHALLRAAPVAIKQSPSADEDELPGWIWVAAPAATIRPFHRHWARPRRRSSPHLRACQAGLVVKIKLEVIFSQQSMYHRCLMIHSGFACS